MLGLFGIFLLGIALAKANNSSHVQVALPNIYVNERCEFKNAITGFLDWNLVVSPCDQQFFFNINQAAYMFPTTKEIVEKGICPSGLVFKTCNRNYYEKVSNCVDTPDPNIVKCSQGLMYNWLEKICKNVDQTVEYLEAYEKCKDKPNIFSCAAIAPGRIFKDMEGKSNTTLYDLFKTCDYRQETFACYDTEIEKCKDPIVSEFLSEVTGAPLFCFKNNKIIRYKKMNKKQ